MPIGDKRKADALGENYMHSKRAAMSHHGHRSAHDSALSTSQKAKEGQPMNDGISWTQQQTITPPTSPLDHDGLPSDLDMEMTDFESPSIEHFQRRISDFCSHHIHLFGQAHQSGIKNAHRELRSSRDRDTTLTAGEVFVASLHDYVQDLQQAAIQQIQWRASIRNIGAAKEVLYAADAVLSQLDAQILSMGAEAENLMQEILMLRGHDHASLMP
ncbi:hypothetical protein DOTSEDRAFT_22585 [Dothistroma septosporum NZE10]|uniref:Uncharacterized protein n=1 Tax=Dothistroma septosporum (strain NZE10 / CBS 128990) TaxID=675120 RepID=N1PT26_DOTSN|nr:hypothetical protein DOTSEDRAFT_22585 [Dothistroma septosporum NZE10]